MVKFFDNYGNFTTSDSELYLSESIFNIYPNPTSDFIYISFEGSDLNQGFMEITDLQGKAVLKAEIYGNAKIDVSKFSYGVYFLKLIKGRKVEIAKFIKL